MKGGNPVLYGFIIAAPEMNIGTIMGQMDAPVPLSITVCFKRSAVLQLYVRSALLQVSKERIDIRCQ